MHLQLPTPSAEELERRREFYRSLAELRDSDPRRSDGSDHFPSVEEMVREDRDR